MFNHGRTLLLNCDGNHVPGASFLGEELVPSGHRAVPLPSYLSVIRSRLFGAEPDRAMLNYRIRQYLQLVHSTELAQLLLDLDPRITYDVVDTTLAADSPFVPQVRQIGDSSASLYLTGTQDSPDSVGKLRYQFDVDVLAPDSIEVKRVIPYPRSWVSTLVLTSGLSNALELAGTGYLCQVNTNSPGTRFLVEGFLRPTWDLSQIELNLRQIGEEYILSLLGITAEEPYQSLRSIWNTHRELPYRLGAIVVAVIYRTEETRTSG